MSRAHPAPIDLATPPTWVCATPLQVADILRAHDDMLVAAHANPDGDALGATCAMGYLLQALGKRFALYNPSGIPPHLHWLQLPGVVHTTLGGPGFKPKLIVSLDCGDVWRLGPDLSSTFERTPSVNIDHHLGNPGFGSLANLVDPTMAATGQIVAAVADAAGVPLTGGLAQGVYVSLVSDTGSFSFGNTTPDVLELAARMMRLGLQAAALREHLDSQWTMAKIRLWAQLLSKVEVEDEGRIAAVTVTAHDMSSTGALKGDLDQFVEQLRCIAGVRVALLVKEEHTNRVKISLRSRGDDDVRMVAVAFGGGGHKNAAGATLDGKISELLPQLMALVHGLWKDAAQGHNGPPAV